MKRRSCYWWLLLCVALVPCIASQSVAQSLSKGKGDLRVMTYNANEGTDYKEVQAAGSPTEFLIAVGQTIRQVRATDPDARMQALATQIIAAGPALVSLQELDQWSTGSFDLATGKCGPVTVEFDMLPTLMDALKNQGAKYEIANHATNWAFPPTPGLFYPEGQFFCLQVVDQIAILARTDLGAKLQIDDKQAKVFDHILVFHSAVGDLPFPRGWISVDATFNKKAFRFINTHLESENDDIQRLQGEEIRLGPANTSLPVIVAMDSNSTAYPFPQGDTYVDFILGGFRDVWSETRPQDPGLTCCQAQLDNNVESELYKRIDLILTFGSVEGQRAALFGADQASKTSSGLWPSDHAGVGAQIVIEKHD